jgi:hypothetical protein
LGLEWVLREAQLEQDERAIEKAESLGRESCRSFPRGLEVGGTADEETQAFFQGLAFAWLEAEFREERSCILGQGTDGLRESKVERAVGEDDAGSLEATDRSFPAGSEGAANPGDTRRREMAWTRDVGKGNDIGEGKGRSLTRLGKECSPQAIDVSRDIARRFQRREEEAPSLGHSLRTFNLQTHGTMIQSARLSVKEIA